MLLLRNIVKSEKFLALSDQALISGSNFISNILLARLLGIEVFGEFSFIWLFILFASGIQSALIIAPLQSLNFSETKTEKIGNSTALWIINVLIMLLLVSIFILFYKKYDNTFQLPAVLILLNLIAFLWNDFVRKLFFTLKTPLKALRLDLISYGSQLILLLLFAYENSLSLETGLLSLLISNFISGIYGIFQVPSMRINVSEIPKSVNYFFNNGKWLAGTSILQWFSGNWFLILAASIISPVAVGAVRIMQNLLGIFHVLFLAMENIIPVNASAAYREGGKNAMLHYIIKIGLQSTLLIVPGFLVLFFFNETIIQLIYGDQYTQQAGLLKIFVLLYAFVFLGTLFRFVLRAENKTKIIFISYIFTSIFGLLSANFFLKEWEAAGIIYGMIVSQVITFICFFLYYFSPKINLQWK